MTSSVGSGSSSSSSDSIELPALRPGVLAFCRFVVRGVVRTARVLVVHAGRHQTIVAAPSDCAIALCGDWVHPQELPVPNSFSCACIGIGATSEIVFYSVDSKSVVSDVFPDSVTFRTSSGNACTPRTQSMMGLFFGEAHEKAPRMQTVSTEAETNGCYHEVRISDFSVPFLSNSILLLPDLLSRAECQMLVDAAETHMGDLVLQRALVGADAAYFDDAGSGLQRLSICNLGREAQELSLAILHERLLPFLEQQLPEVAQSLFGQASALTEKTFSFSPDEPAINRYSVGGEFKVHQDCLAVTINVLLSEPGAFIGGGTAFWQQDAVPRAECALGPSSEPSFEPSLEPSIDDALLLQPHPGTGVLFNGKVQHSGRPVQSGTRHLYVASFNLD